MNINLLPWREILLQKRRFQFYRVSFCSLLSSLFVLFSSHVTINHFYQIDIVRYHQWQQKINNWHQAQQTYLIAPHIASLIHLKQLQTERQQLLKNLFVITESLPDSCLLTQIHYHQGWVIQGQAPNTDAITRYIHQLRTGHHFKRVTLKNVIKQKFFIFSMVVL